MSQRKTFAIRVRTADGNEYFWEDAVGLGVTVYMSGAEAGDKAKALRDAFPDCVYQVKPYGTADVPADTTCFAMYKRLRYDMANRKPDFMFDDTSHEVRKFADSAEADAGLAAALYYSTNYVSCVVPFATADDETLDMLWHMREAKRLSTEHYTPLPWHNAEWWAVFCRNNERIAHYYPHTAKGDASKVAYTPTAEHGRSDRQVVTTFGRFLVKACGMSNDKASDIACEYDPHTRKLMLADTPDDIEHVYTSGPSSCMGHSIASYQSDIHPTRVYGAGDLAVAYITDGDEDGRITARTLVHKENMVYTTMYGDRHRLMPVLVAAGYSEGTDNDFEGARLLAIRQGDGYVVPYCDAVDAARVMSDGKHLALSYRGDITLQNVNGLSISSYCSRCEDSVDEDDMRCVQDEYVCECCADNHSFYCEDCCANYWDDDGYASIDNGTLVCMSCFTESGNYFECSECNSNYHVDDLLGTTEDGEAVCNDCDKEYVIEKGTGVLMAKRNATECEDCGEYHIESDMADETEDGKEICTDCARSYTLADDTGKLISDDEAAECEYCMNNVHEDRMAKCGELCKECDEAKDNGNNKTSEVA